MAIVGITVAVWKLSVGKLARNLSGENRQTKTGLSQRLRHFKEIASIFGKSGSKNSLGKSSFVKSCLPFSIVKTTLNLKLIADGTIIISLQALAARRANINSVVRF